MYTITPTPQNHPDLMALIAELDAYQQTLYPAESNHLIDLSALPAESVIALLIRDTQRQAVGCGAIVLGEEGIHQHAAVALYTRNGYQTRSAFAPYQPDPLSIFMEKMLLADLRSAAL